MCIVIIIDTYQATFEIHGHIGMTENAVHRNQADELIYCPEKKRKKKRDNTVNETWLNNHRTN